MKKHLLTILICLNLVLIWGNSMVTAADSSAMSGGILEFLGQFFPMLLTEAGHTFLRKAAHFSEFALLGLLFCGRYRLVHRTTPPHLIGFGLAAACIDETIQIFTPGRASSLIDVWIDTAGFALGFVVIFAVSAIYHNKIKGD